MSTETKSLAAKITNGAWKAKRLRDNGGAPYATLYEAHIDLGVCMVWAPEGNEEQEANAELIADAGTTYNSCHLTPSELLAKLREAAAMIVRIGYSCDDLGHRKDQYHNWDQPCPVVAEIDAFLSNLPK